MLADIFNTLPSVASVHTYLKTATKVAIPKHSIVTGLNDYQPIDLSVALKCFERIVATHIKDSIDITVDPYQYAYRRNCSSVDTVS